MGPLHAPQEELDALEQGRAFADLSSFRKVRVRGTDARAWLHDLLTCDVATIRPGMSRRSLLLSPTGRIRADLAVAQDDDGLVLLQSADQDDAIGPLLQPYVLSSGVTLIDRTQDLGLLAFPGRAVDAVDTAAPASVLAPSVLGPGIDLLTPGRSGAPDALTEVSADAIEVWRIRRGVPRMGADFGQDSLPAEAGLEDTIDLTKGCFLGQESVARVRNLGHPPRVLRHLRAQGPVEAGTPVRAGTEVAGTLTSAAVGHEASETVGIARVRWEFAAAGLTAADGLPLLPVGSMD